jgi:hypothetical protein
MFRCPRPSRTFCVYEDDDDVDDENGDEDGDGVTKFGDC